MSSRVRTKVNQKHPARFAWPAHTGNQNTDETIDNAYCAVVWRDCVRTWDELPLRVTTILSTLRDAHFITACAYDRPWRRAHILCFQEDHAHRRYRGSARWPALARPVMDEIEEGFDSVNQ